MNALLLREVVRLLMTTNFSNRHIARVLNISPNTVKYYRDKIPHTRLVCWEDAAVMDDYQLSKCFKQEKTATVLERKPEQPNVTIKPSGKRMPDWIRIHKLMQEKHQTLIFLWEEYCLNGPDDAYAYSQFTYHYRQYKKSLDISMRQIHHPGECTYVDFAGKRIPWADINTGKEHYAEIFVAVLGYSQYTFAYACNSQKSECFVNATVKMHEFYGGVTEAIVPDNLKSAVIKAGRFPKLNRIYVEMANHYGCVIEPARVRRPQDKSLSEIGVLLVTRWITVLLRRRKFFSVAEINEAIFELLNKLNERPFKRMPGNRKQRFDEVDKPALKPLPRTPFVYGKWLSAKKVPQDYLVYIHGHAYSVPYQFIGQYVEARINEQKVEFFHQNRRIACHVRSQQQGGATMNDNHRPANHLAYAKQSKSYYLEWAEKIGEPVLSVVTAQFENKAEYSIVACKACGRLQSLAKQYGAVRLVAACQCACNINSLTISSVRSILQCKLDTSHQDEQAIQMDLPLHHNVRGADYYTNVEV